MAPYQPSDSAIHLCRRFYCVVGVSIWVVFALLSVVFKSSYYAYQKAVFNEDDSFSSFQTALITSVYGAITLLPIGGWFVWTGRTAVAPIELAIVIGIGVFELFAFLVYLQALERLDLSIASPIKKSKPVFVALAEPVLLGATFGLPLLLAAAASSLGTYVTMMDGDLFSPFRRLAKRGVQLAFLAMLMSAGLSLASRFGTTTLSPFVYGAIIYTTMTVGYTVLGVTRTEFTLPQREAYTTRTGGIIGTLGVLRSITVWIAYSLAVATAVTTVTQLTIIVSVLLGGTVLKEGNTARRVVGACLVLCGVFLAILV